MRRLLFTAVVTGAIAAACAQTSPVTPLPTPATVTAPESCPALADAMERCTPAACSQRHPFMRAFQIEHRVAGPEGDRCVYSQTMPGDMLMTCRFSAEGRAEMAGLVREMERGNLSGGTGQQNAMTRECEVRDSNGAVIPWG
ncbi:MAG: hypothetical protein R3C27_14300 [Hyphomonadaceae bacterium]